MTTTNLIADNSTVTWTDGAYINPSTGVSTPLNNYSHTDVIDVLPNNEYTLKIGGYGIAWYDTNDVFISVSGNSSEPVNMRTVTSPANAVKCIVIYLTAKKQEFRMYEGSDFYEKTLIDGVEIHTKDRHWKNKRIAWYGTSIPAGFPNQSNQWSFAYPDILARSMGADIQNYCVAGGTIRRANTSNVQVNPPQSFTNTQFLTSTNYVSKIVDLIGTELEPDLFVFDYGVNDYVNDPSDIDNVAGYDFTSEDDTTFLGAYNKVLKALFTAKPTAKVLLLTHFSDDGVQVGTQSVKDCWKTLNDLILKIGEYWNIPVIDLTELTGMRKVNGVENISIYAPDFIHPASDSNKLIINDIARLCERFILDNIATTQIVQQVVTPPPPPPPPPSTGGCTGIGEYNEATSHYLMPTGALNVWGHGFRLCGMTGGYTDGVGYFDVNGTATTKALAFPNGIICDLKYVTCSGDFVMYQNNMSVTGNVIYSAAVAACDAYNLGGFTGWQLISRKEFNQIAVFDDVSYVFNYPPFDNSAQYAYWTRDALFFAGDYTRRWRIDQYQSITFSFETQSAGRAMPTRIGNISEF